MDAQLVLRLSAELKADLEWLALEDRRPTGDYVRMVLEDHVAAVKKDRKKGGKS